MDLLPPHPPPPNSAGATAPPPRPNTIPPANLPPAPSATAPAAVAPASAAPSAVAPAPSSSATPDDRTTAFHAVDTQSDQGLGTTLLVEAYSAIWVIMMGFVLLSWRKQGALGTRLDELEKAIDKSEAAKQKKD
jgi:hypothetical protein